MSNEQEEFKYGEISFFTQKSFFGTEVRYTIVPEGYLVQELDNPLKIYIFRTFKDIEDYFDILKNDKKEI